MSGSVVLNSNVMGRRTTRGWYSTVVGLAKCKEFPFFRQAEGVVVPRRAVNGPVRIGLEYL